MPSVWYDTSGEGDAVVFLAGGMLDSRQWDEQLPVVARTHRAIRIDTRGYGKSPTPSQPFVAYEDVADVLRELTIPRASFVGSSLGGRIAIDFAIAHPEMTNALLLAAPGVSGYVPSESTMRDLASVFAAKTPDEMIAAMLALPTMAPRPDRVEARERFVAMLRDGIRGVSLAPFYRELDPPAMSRLAEVKVPVTLVLGDADHQDLVDLADKIQREVAGVKRITVPGARHLVNMDEPEAFNRILEDWLLHLQS